MVQKNKKNQIIELRKRGFSYDQISKELNCTKSTISYHLKNADLSGRKNAFIRDIENKIIKQIIYYRQQNKTYDEIRSLVNISEDKLKKICRDNLLNRSSTIFKEKELNGEEIINFYNEHGSLRKTAKYFNTTTRTVKKIIPDDLIKFRKETKIKKPNSKSVIDTRIKNKIELVNYKGGKCEICGYNKSLRALEFHHVNPEEKNFGIAGKTYSLDKLKKEADKCILVCSNCHSEIHDGSIVLNKI